VNSYATIMCTKVVGAVLQIPYLPSFLRGSDSGEEKRNDVVVGGGDEGSIRPWIRPATADSAKDGMSKEQMKGKTPQTPSSAASTHTEFTLRMTDALGQAQKKNQLVIDALKYHQFYSAEPADSAALVDTSVDEARKAINNLEELVASARQDKELATEPLLYNIEATVQKLGRELNDHHLYIDVFKKHVLSKKVKLEAMKFMEYDWDENGLMKSKKMVYKRPKELHEIADQSN